MIMCFFMSIFAQFPVAYASDNNKKHIVLVLDTSGNSDFLDDNNKVFYTSSIYLMIKL